MEPSLRASGLMRLPGCLAEIRGQEGGQGASVVGKGEVLKKAAPRSEWKGRGGVRRHSGP